MYNSRQLNRVEWCGDGGGGLLDTIRDLGENVRHLYICVCVCTTQLIGLPFYFLRANQRRRVVR